MDQATHNKIVSFIWGIADDVLRDLFKRGKYPDVILPMCVLRRFDAVLEPTKQKVLETKAVLDQEGITEQHNELCKAAGQAFYNTSPFTLKDLASRSSQQQLKADFESYLDGFSENVQDILENCKFRNQISTLSKADALATLINKFRDPEINLGPNPVLNGDGTVKHPGMDNHSMGTVFEELVRKFNEDNNEEAGEHWTPRDAVKLMTNLIFLPIANQINSGTYLLYDGACGTGGMLTLAEETLTTLTKQQGKKVVTNLYGQEINPETYAICKADMLLKGEGENAANIVGGAEFSTLLKDAFPTQAFDFMLSNPPYGKSWKKDLDAMGGKDNMRDPRFQIKHAGDPEFSLITRSSDGQLLFLANMVSKMNHKTPLGSRIAEVHNGSSLFTGDAGQGESNIRRWIIENDWLEAIVALPLNLFYNTGIATYIWVLTNRKPAPRKGQVQLIDATQWFKPLRKNLGKKNCELSPEDIDRICQTYLAFEQTEQSKVFPNQAFGYWKVTVERPLRLASQLTPFQIAKLRFASGDEEIRSTLYDEFGDDLLKNFPAIQKALETRLAEWGDTSEDPESEDAPKKGLPEKIRRKLTDPATWKRDAKLTDAAHYLRDKMGDEISTNFNLFREEAEDNLDGYWANITPAEKKHLIRTISWREESAEPVIAKIHKTGKPNPIHGLYHASVKGKKALVQYEPDTELRDTEQIPLLEPSGIEAFLNREVLPYTPDAWLDPTKTQIGYEISFTRHFYKPKPLRTLEEIRRDILAVQQESEGLLEEILKGGAN